MGKKLSKMIDAVQNGTFKETGIPYEIVKEVIVPEIKSITRAERYAINKEISEVLKLADGTQYEPSHFGWIENKVAKAIYPANECAVMSVEGVYYYVPKELVDNVTKGLSNGSKKAIANFEESMWIPHHIDFDNKDKKNVSKYIIFNEPMKDKLKNGTTYILPGVGISKLLYDGEFISSQNLSLVKLKDGTVYTYYVRDNATDDLVDLSEFTASEIANDLPLNSGEQFMIDMNLDKLSSKFVPYGQYLNGKTFNIPNSSKKDLTTLVKSIQENTATISQLDKFETITGVGYRILAQPEVENSTFIKFPHDARFRKMSCGIRLTSPETISLWSGVHVTSSSELLKIMGRIMSNTYTEDDMSYVLNNAI